MQLFTWMGQKTKRFCPSAFADPPSSPPQLDFPLAIPHTHTHRQRQARRWHDAWEGRARRRSYREVSYGRLVERVVTSVEREITGGMPVTQTSDAHWGQALNRLLDALDLSDWEALEIDDPVEWVKTLRHKDESRLDAYWNDPQ